MCAERAHRRQSQLGLRVNLGAARARGARTHRRQSQLGLRVNLGWPRARGARTHTGDSRSLACALIRGAFAAWPAGYAGTWLAA